MSRMNETTSREGITQKMIFISVDCLPLQNIPKCWFVIGYTAAKS